MKLKITATTAYINGKVVDVVTSRKSLAAMMKHQLGMGKQPEPVNQ